MEVTSTPSSGAKKPHRGRFWRLLLVLVLLAVVFVGLWGFVPANVDEEVPANLKVMTGQAFIKRKGQPEWRPAKGLASLSSKSSVRVEAGGEAFLVHFDGGMSRLTGPVEVELAESRRTIDGPSTFGGVLVRMLGKEPTGRTQVSTSVSLRPINGTLITRASTSPNAQLLVVGPNYRALVPPGAAFRTNLTPGKAAWWESLKGTTSLGILSVAGDMATPVVVPALVTGTRILISAIPTQYVENPRVGELSAKLARALPQLKEAAPTSVEGMTFRVMRDNPRLPYLAGESIALAAGAGPAPAGPAPAVQAVAAPAASAESLLAVPGTDVRSIDDREIVGHLPAGMKAHIVGGNVVEVTYGGVTYSVRVDVVGGRVQFSGLPLGLDPGPLMERFAEDIPTIFW